jgi:hypothetical protein
VLLGVPAYVQMYTLIGRPHAGVCALWAASCFPGAGLRVTCSAISPDKYWYVDQGGEIVPFVRQIAIRMPM